MPSKFKVTLKGFTLPSLQWRNLFSQKENIEPKNREVNHQRDGKGSANLLENERLSFRIKRNRRFNCPPLFCSSAECNYCILCPLDSLWCDVNTASSMTFHYVNGSLCRSHHSLPSSNIIHMVWFLTCNFTFLQNQTRPEVMAIVNKSR